MPIQPYPRQSQALGAPTYLSVILLCVIMRALALSLCLAATCGLALANEQRRLTMKPLSLATPTAATTASDAAPGVPVAGLSGKVQDPLLLTHPFRPLNLQSDFLGTLL